MRPDRLRNPARDELEVLEDQIAIGNGDQDPQKQAGEAGAGCFQRGRDARPTGYWSRDVFLVVAGAPTPARGNLIRSVEDFHGAGRQGNLVEADGAASSASTRSWLPSGAIVLAPMDGVTDHVYRALITSRARPGRISLCVSEFIRVTDRPISDAAILRGCPELSRGGTTQSGVPVMVQLLGGRAEPLAASARRAVQLGAFGIDLNFGCPAKLVNRHDGGAALLKAPERIEGIVLRVRQAVPLDHPVSVKIRLGWESVDEVVPIAVAAERGGASWLTIHGRTKAQMYGPPADWEAIGRARASVSVDVVANGDLSTDSSLERCRDASGCTHFMLGRGPMGRPSLLCGAANGSEAQQLQMLTSMLVEYLERLSAAGNPEYRQVARVKQWLSLGKTQNADVAPVFERIKRLSKRAEVLAALSSG